MKERIAKLIDLKSIITLGLAITLMYGFIVGKIEGKDFLVYVTMVFTFYFAKKDSQVEPQEATQNEVEKEVG